MPSYGDNSDYAPGTTQHGTTMRYNYRLRGIPTGTYSLLVQAIPIVDIVPNGSWQSAGARGYVRSLQYVSWLGLRGRLHHLQLRLANRCSIRPLAI